jgi:hypothetical protein
VVEIYFNFYIVNRDSVGYWISGFYDCYKKIINVEEIEFTNIAPILIRYKIIAN